MSEFKNILVATDFSPPAERAVEVAVTFAKTFDAKLTLLHVYELPTTYGYAGGMVWPIEELARAAQESLDAALSKLREKYPRAEGLLGSGTPSQQILALARERKADLVVLGTHGRRGLSHAFFGSVAEKVVRLSPVPVLTIGPGATG
jgi:nucleotide-binding universal stress UspA family protein